MQRVWCQSNRVAWSPSIVPLPLLRGVGHVRCTGLEVRVWVFGGHPQLWLLTGPSGGLRWTHVWQLPRPSHPHSWMSCGAHQGDGSAICLSAWCKFCGHSLQEMRCTEFCSGKLFLKKASPPGYCQVVVQSLIWLAGHRTSSLFFTQSWHFDPHLVFVPWCSRNTGDCQHKLHHHCMLSYVCGMALSLSVLVITVIACVVGLGCEREHLGHLHWINHSTRGHHWLYSKGIVSKNSTMII